MNNTTQATEQVSVLADLKNEDILNLAKWATNRLFEYNSRKDGYGCYHRDEVKEAIVATLTDCKAWGDI